MVGEIVMGMSVRKVKRASLHSFLFVTLVACLAGVRIVYFLQAPNHPGFNIFLFPDDQEYYHRMALHIAEGNILAAKGNLVRGPGYIYFLALLYKVSGSSTIFARIVQFMMGMFTGIFVYMLGKRFFNTTAGLTAGFLYAFYLPVLCYEGAVLMTSLITFLMTAGLLCFITGVRRKKNRYLLLAGLLYGWAFLCRPNNIIMALVLGGWLVSKKKGWRPVIYFFIGLVYLYPLLMIRNYLAGGDLLNITTQGKLVLLCGHWHDSPAIGWTRTVDEPDIIQRSAGSFMRFLSILGNDILTHFPHWLKTQLNKVYMYFFGYEFSQFIDFYTLRQTIPILRAVHIPFYLLSPLAVIGSVFLVVRRKRRYNALFVVYFVLAVVSVVMFYIISRFRHPALPLFCLSGGYAIFFFGRLARQGRWGRCLIVVMLMAVLVWAVTLKPKWDYFSTVFSFSQLFNRANLYILTEEYDKALDDLNHCLTIDQFSARASFYKGVVYLRKQDLDNALYWMNKARKLGDDSDKVHYYMGLAYKMKGDFKRAIEHFYESIDRGGDRLSASNQLAQSYILSGDEQSAVKIWMKNAKLYPDNYSAYYNLGCYFANTKQFDKAYRYMRMAQELNPGYCKIDDKLQFLEMQINKRK